MEPTLQILNALVWPARPDFPPNALLNITCSSLSYGDDDPIYSLAPPLPAQPTPTASPAPFASVSTYDETNNVIDAKGSVVIVGGLAVPHIHIDKCHLLDRTPIVDGSFGEALRGTALAKANFTKEDVIQRGTRLLEESLSHGVATVRAHVEVDASVGIRCLMAGFALKHAFKSRCEVRLVLFAQDPFFYPPGPDFYKEGLMSTLFETAVELQPLALRMPTPDLGTISAVGSAPYVERNDEMALKNIRRVFELAKSIGCDVDFHLDYDLDRGKRTLVWDVLKIAKEEGNSWLVEDRERRITLGHCTKLSLFDKGEFDRLEKEIKDGLEGQVHFVALPNSDIYMQGRETQYATRSRATLPAFELVKRGIPCSIAVNNVANLFTPQGDGDPLALLPMLVGVWQSASPASLQSLLVRLPRSILPSPHA